MAIVPTADDHGAHIASKMPRVECKECQWLRRWPVKKIGYMVPAAQGGWMPVGWEFDTSEPDTFPWMHGDIIRFANTEREILAIPTIEDHERNTRK